LPSPGLLQRFRVAFLCDTALNRPDELAAVNAAGAEVSL